MAAVKSEEINGIQFLRQKPIGQFIANFYCPKLNLVIEVDGSSHLLPDNQMRDERKDRYLKSIGLHILRIEDSAVKHYMTAVLQELENWIEQNRRQYS